MCGQWSSVPFLVGHREVELEQGLLKLNYQRITWKRVGDELVALDLETSSYLSINDTGAVLWDRLQAGATRADLVAALVDEFEVTPDIAAGDVDDFISDMTSRGLLLG